MHIDCTGKTKNIEITHGQQITYRNKQTTKTNIKNVSIY